MKNSKTLIKRIEKLEDELKRTKKELNNQLDPRSHFPFWAWFISATDPTTPLALVEVTGFSSYTNRSRSGRHRKFYKRSDNSFIPKEWDCGDDNDIARDLFVRLASPDEIYDHLLPLAEKKGFVDGARCININGNENGNSVIGSKRWRYYPEINSLFNASSLIYKNGLWAELIDKLPTFKELGVEDMVTTALPFKSKQRQKLFTFAKLMAVANYVNEGWEPDWEDKDQKKYNLGYNFNKKEWTGVMTFTFPSKPVHFKSVEARAKAIEIFRFNNAEQELIDFFR